MQLELFLVFPPHCCYPVIAYSASLTELVLYSSVGIFPSTVFLYRGAIAFAECWKPSAPCSWRSWIYLDEKVRLQKDEWWTGKWSLYNSMFEVNVPQALISNSCKHQLNNSWAALGIALSLFSAMNWLEILSLNLSLLFYIGLEAGQSFWLQMM